MASQRTLDGRVIYCSFVGMMATPQIPGTYEYVTLHANRNFADVVIVMDLKIGLLFWIIGWTQSNHTSPSKQRTFWMGVGEM